MATIEVEEKTQKIENDCHVLLGLLNEHFHSNVTMRIKYLRHGFANPRLKRFTVPSFAIARGETYAFYYVIHEFTHACFDMYSHGTGFKKTEDTLLSMFGITIERAKAYPKSISLNGETKYYKTTVKKTVRR